MKKNTPALTLRSAELRSRVLAHLKRTRANPVTDEARQGAMSDFLARAVLRQLAAENEEMGK